MDRATLGTAILSALVAPSLCAAQAPETVVVADFEEDAEGWRFVGGEEFPGARGSLAQDTEVAHGGGKSLRLSADFEGGGEYVGLWTELPDLGGGFLKEIRFWARSEGVPSVGVRLGDNSGQCHQAKNIPIEADGEWHEVVLPLAELVGEESWGGANDRKWHGPPGGFGLNIGRPALTDGTKGTLWVDDVVCMVSTDPPGRPTILAGVLEHDSCRPGFGTDLLFRWDAQPMGRDFTVFVHFKGPDGATPFQGDHEPPVPTSVWEGRVEYERTVVLPTTAAEGEYEVYVGLYSHAGAERGWDRQTLETGEGVEVGEDGTSYRIATLTVDPEAPVPELGPPTLDLDGYRMTFSEEFDGELDVSAWGPGTKWIAHTPYAGDFGDAGFADPEEGFPFVVSDGLLRIEAKREGDRWRSGLICSVDPKAEGFSQQYGYFEMKAKLPKGEGTWPAFWLLGAPRLKDKTVDSIEIDVVEQYGVGPNALHTVVHLWYGDGRHTGDGRPSIVEGMTDDFHTYGVLVTADDIVFYFDGVELRRVPTPEEAKVPLYILANLALGGGWPIDNTPDPSHMYIDHIRAYAK